MDWIGEGFGDAFRLVASGDPQVLHAVFVSLSCTSIALVIASLLAIPYGAWLGLYRPRGTRVQVVLLRTGMAVPTVVIGLLVFAFLSRRGPLGEMDLLYTKTAITIGEVLLAFPLLASLLHAATASLDPEVAEASLTLGAGRGRTLVHVLGEVRAPLVSALLATFGRCVTELGVALTVGGGIAMHTRTLPAMTARELSRGEFGRALAPGIILLLLACLAALLAYALGREERS